MFPMAFPQLTRHIMGRIMRGLKFRRSHAVFFGKIRGGVPPDERADGQNQFCIMKISMRKSILIPAAYAFVAAILANGCSAKKNSAGAGSAPVLAAKAGAKNVPVQINPPPVGHVMPVSTVTI